MRWQSRQTLAHTFKKLHIKNYTFIFILFCVQNTPSAQVLGLAGCKNEALRGVLERNSAELEVFPSNSTFVTLKMPVQREVARE